MQKKLFPQAEGQTATFFQVKRERVSRGLTTHIEAGALNRHRYPIDLNRTQGETQIPSIGTARRQLGRLDFARKDGVTGNQSISFDRDWLIQKGFKRGFRSADSLQRSFQPDGEKRSGGNYIRVLERRAGVLPATGRSRAWGGNVAGRLTLKWRRAALGCVNSRQFRPAMRATEGQHKSHEQRGNEPAWSATPAYAARFHTHQ